MMRSIFVCLGILSAPVHAGTILDRKTGSIGELVLEGQTDVTLYSNVNDQPIPSVEVKIGDNFYLFELRPGLSSIYFGEYLVQKEELKNRKTNKKLLNVMGKKKKWGLGGKLEWCSLDSMSIGGMTLNDVTAQTVDINELLVDLDKSEEGYSRMTLADQLHGYIGLNALPDDVNWAIQPSLGTVSFARGEAAAQLVRQSGAVSLPYRSAPSIRTQHGKGLGPADSRTLLNERSMIIEGLIDGKKMDIWFAPGGANVVDSRQELTDVPKANRGDLQVRYISAELGGVSLEPRWSIYTHLEYLPGIAVDAILSTTSIANLDVFVDASAQVLHLKTTTGQVRNNPLPLLIAEADKAVQPEEEEQTEEDGEASASGEASEADTGGEAAQVVAKADAVVAKADAVVAKADAVVADKGEEAPEDDSEDDTEDEDKPPGTEEDWVSLAHLLTMSGRIDAGIDAHVNATLLSDSCLAWVRLGKAQLKAGKVADAIVSFETSADKYHGWFDMPREERKKLQKKLKKTKSDDKPDIVASAKCHDADAHLAAAVLSAGDFETVESLYRERLDLASKLALVAANARLAKGEHHLAQEPLRQAAKINRTPDSRVRLGLAMVYEKAGDWGTAEGHYLRALQWSSSDTRLVEMWLDGLRAAKGGEAALAAAQHFAAMDPGSRAAVYGLAREAKQTGNAEAIEAASALADMFFDKKLDTYSRNGSLWGVYARYLLINDRLEEAQQAAELAVQFDAESPDAWMALAEIQLSQGNKEESAQFRLRAAQVAPFHPGYAAMLGEF